MSRSERTVLISLILLLVLGVALRFKRDQAGPPRLEAWTDFRHDRVQMPRAKNERELQRKTQRSSAKTRPSRKPRAAPSVLDLNRASAAELESLPGIGPVLAEKIVRHRSQRGAFQRKSDLLDLPEISLSLYRKLEPFLMLEPQ